MQVEALLGEINVLGDILGLSILVRSHQGTYLSASAGHAATHFGFPLQRKHLVALLVSGSKDIMSQGQAR